MFFFLIRARHRALGLDYEMATAKQKVFHTCTADPSPRTSTAILIDLLLLTSSQQQQPETALLIYTLRHSLQTYITYCVLIHKVIFLQIIEVVYFISVNFITLYMYTGTSFINQMELSNITNKHFQDYLAQFKSV